MWLWLLACQEVPECLTPLGLTEANQIAGEDVVWQVQITSREVQIDRSGRCPDTPNCTFTERLVIEDEYYSDKACPLLVEGWYRTEDPEAGGYEAVYDDSMFTLQDWEPLELISGTVWDRSFYLVMPETAEAP